MSANIITYPRRKITGGTNVSDYSALHFPIIYEIQRSDYLVSSVQRRFKSQPVARIAIFGSVFETVVNLSNPVSAPDIIKTGDQIYLRSGNWDRIIEVVDIYTATQFSFKNISANYNANPLVNSVGGFINLNTARGSYYIETQVLSSNSNIYYVLGTIQNRPDNRGIVRVDVQPFVKGIEGYNNTFLYNVPNKSDFTLSNLFNIRYVEHWNTSNGEISASPITPTSMMYFVNAAKQLLDKYGQNMGEYVPFPVTSTPAKFLNGYTPTYFVGFPMDLAFIYSGKVSSYTLRRRADFINNDPNNNTSAPQQNLDIAYRFYVNRLMLPVPPAGTRYMNVYIQIDNSQPPLNTSYVNETYFHVPGVQHIISAHVNDPDPPPHD